ncbi:MAG TPA: CYTH domain-containing protein, partial [Stenotrophobium sp.]|nr:CYTH domain-containing protein [Stenotrophobium sp.]
EGGRASVRVRLEGDQARLNIKAAVIGAARAEYEYGIPVADARELLQLCAGRLQKTRHHVEVGGLLWEIDEFHGDNAPLVVAELELAAIDQAFMRPDWLGNEVTDDRRYYNHHLALHPYRHWPDAP